MTDDLESSLRSSLQTIAIPYDDRRADEMISAAAAGRPRPDRRALLAPLATAATVAALGLTVAAVAHVGGGPDRHDRPGTPSAAGRAVVLTYTFPGPRLDGGFWAVPTTTLVEVTADGYRPSEFVDSAFGRSISVDRIMITNPHLDRASVRVTRGITEFLTQDMSGRRTSTRTASLPATEDPIEATMQCRAPGSGDRCDITVKVFGTLYPPSVPSTPAPSPGAS